MSKHSLPTRVFSYFAQGVFIFAPFAITIYLVWWSFKSLDGLIPWLPTGMGLLVIFFIFTFAGYVSQSLIVRPIFDMLERVLMRIPIVKIIYTSLKDLLSAFISDKRKFEYPVLVIVNKDSDIKRMGFITQKDLSEYGIYDQVAVYCPHSYNFSGNLFIVPKENIILLENIKSADAMKFVVSGGVSGVAEPDATKSKKRSSLTVPLKVRNK